jgi:hypothetical protein
MLHFLHRTTCGLRWTPLQIKQLITCAAWLDWLCRPPLVPCRATKQQAAACRRRLAAAQQRRQRPVALAPAQAAAPRRQMAHIGRWPPGDCPLAAARRCTRSQPTLSEWVWLTIPVSSESCSVCLPTHPTAQAWPMRCCVNCRDLCFDMLGYEHATIGMQSSPDNVQWVFLGKCSHLMCAGLPQQAQVLLLTPCPCTAGCSWFKFESISETERRLMPNWFAGCNETRNPSVSEQDAPCVHLWQQKKHRRLWAL